MQIQEAGKLIDMWIWGKVNAQKLEYFDDYRL